MLFKNEGINTIPSHRRNNYGDRPELFEPGTINGLSLQLSTTNNKKLSYRRETARELHTSFSARSLIVHFTEHRILLCNYIID